MSIILVNVIGLVLIGLIIWWFLFAKGKVTTVKDNRMDILVKNGVYEPAVISTQKGQTLKLHFLREDESSCAAIVRFDAFNINAELPLNKTHVITISLDQAGEFEFTCQMGMYRGKLIVR